MLFCFAEDARQRHPFRERMGPLVGTGGLIVSGRAVARLERAIDAFCQRYGLPSGEEFKWVPRRDQWMWAGLVEGDRAEFFAEVLAAAAGHAALAVVVIEEGLHDGGLRQDMPSATQGSLPASVSAGKPTLDVDFPYAWYLRALANKIDEQWEGRALPGSRPLVVFEISRDGRPGHDCRFIITRLEKRHHARLKFVDTIIDSGINPAVPAHVYGNRLLRLGLAHAIVSNMSPRS